MTKEMYCKKCGKELEDGVGFCSNCGQPVSGDLPSSESKRKKPIIGVVIFILVLLVAVLVVALVLSLRNGDKAADNNIESGVTDTAGNDIEDGNTDEIVTAPENNNEGEITDAPEGGVADSENGNESEQSTQSPDVEPEKVIDPERLAALEESVAAYKEYIDNHADRLGDGDISGYKLVYIADNEYPICFFAKPTYEGSRYMMIMYLSYAPVTHVTYSGLTTWEEEIFDSASLVSTRTISYNEETEYIQVFYYANALQTIEQYNVYKYSEGSGKFEEVLSGLHTNMHGSWEYTLDKPVHGEDLSQSQFEGYLNAYGEYTDSFTWEDMYGTLDEAMEAVTAP